VAGRNWRSAAPPQRAQHYLASRQLAEEIARAAEIEPCDLVLDLGAGFGRLTQGLVGKAGQVIAVEIDGKLAARLTSRFSARSDVRVVQDDALAVALPRRPFRVVSNPPFHLTSRLLRRLLDEPEPNLIRADLVLDWRAAIGLTSVSPPSWQSMAWQPWFQFFLVRRLPASWFTPEPSTDAGLVSIRRRTQPLLDPREAVQFRRWMRRQSPRLDVWELVRRYRG
jgi:23S rRNA (adenine-N6)-dimethyltransferase